jgi:hypothetical protein
MMPSAPSSSCLFLPSGGKAHQRFMSPTSPAGHCPGEHKAIIKTPLMFNCLTKQVQRDGDTRGLYLRVCYCDKGFGTGWLFSCLMSSPGERAGSCLDHCLREPKYSSSGIMWSVYPAFQALGGLEGTGELATSRSGREGARAGNNGAEGFVTESSVSLWTLWPPQIGPSSGIVGMLKSKQLSQGFCISAWSLVSRWKEVIEGRRSLHRVIHVRPHEMGW